MCCCFIYSICKWALLKLFSVINHPLPYVVILSINRTAAAPLPGKQTSLLTFTGSFQAWLGTIQRQISSINVAERIYGSLMGGGESNMRFSTMWGNIFLTKAMGEAEGKKERK